MRIVTYGVGGYDPNQPNNNIISDVTVSDPIEQTNLANLVGKARNAVATNTNFQTNAATVTYPLSAAAQQALVNEVVAMSRQNNALIKIVLGLVLADMTQLADTTGT